MASIQRKDIYWLITTVISLAAVLVFFLRPLSPKPPEELLSIEFHRIKAGSSTPLIFKMMEGAYLERNSGFSSENFSQYSVLGPDGEMYGLVLERFKDIWANWPFRDHRPVGTKFWSHISGKQESHEYIGFLNTVAISQGAVSEFEYGKNFICFFQLSSLNEDGKGWIPDYVGTSLYGSKNDDALCDLLDYDPYDFFYTAVTFENNSDKIIKDFRIQYTDATATLGSVYDVTPSNNSYSSGPCRNLRDDDWNNCVFKDVVQYMNTAVKVGVPALPRPIEMSGRVSVINPGEKIFMLLNAYVPNDDNLPKEILQFSLNISSISYNVEGHIFSDESVVPLGSNRLGIITTPSGGIGGQ